MSPNTIINKIRILRDGILFDLLMYVGDSTHFNHSNFEVRLHYKIIAAADINNA